MKVYPNETMEKPDYGFSDGDFSIPENMNPASVEKSLWAFEQDTETGVLIVVPMNGEKLVIHGKREAEMFCQFLIDCFQ